MITVHLPGTSFTRRERNDFTDIVSDLRAGSVALRAIPVPVIVDILHAFGERLIREDSLRAFPGVAYIAQWSRRANLLRLIEQNYGSASFHSYSEGPTEYKICLEPRGIAAHFVAGNIPHLTFFSLMLALLSKNASILKVPPEHAAYMLGLLRVLGKSSIVHGRRRYTGAHLLKAISVVTFPSSDTEASKAFSLAADARIVWGGAEAVESIRGLPQKAHAETIVFGPKYSFGLFDRTTIKSKSFPSVLARAARDMVMFDQMACSSPHTYFFEKGGRPLEDIAELLRTELEKLPGALKRRSTSPSLSARILLERGRYYLDPAKKIFAPPDLSWSIFLNHEPGLEEPVQGGCIFLKEVASLDDVIPLVTRKIQAVGIAIGDVKKRRSIAERLAYAGVERVVPHGSMHDFTLPWDGILPLSRLVRWTSLKE